MANETMSGGDVLIDARGEDDQKHSLHKRDTKYIRWDGHDLPCGTYKSCTAASRQNGVSKWFGYRTADGPCPLTIEKLTPRDTDMSSYVSK